MTEVLIEIKKENERQAPFILSTGGYLRPLRHTLKSRVVGKSSKDARLYSEDKFHGLLLALVDFRCKY